MADKYEGVLARPPANAFTIAGEVELFDLGVLRVGEGDVNEADWLVCVGARRARARTRDAGNGDAERCASAVADAFGKRAGYLGGDGSFAGDQFGGNVRERSFECVAINDGAAQ